jgi:uncharacterized protein YbbC (DUF1343 family)
MKYSKFNKIPDLSWFKNTVLFSLLIIFGCQAQENSNKEIELKTGADQIELYLPLLKGKHVAVVANQTSVVADYKGDLIHLVDTLIALDVNVKTVFAPEHGFRGKADAGEKVKDSFDSKTGLPIISLYGKHKKPTEEDLNDIDVVVFDIQDVGVRFYTYISTLHYVMEACAEQNIPALVLDRPNPNRHYVDGPVLEDVHKSFVGMHPVPVVYGMTIGEYAKMINGEGWLNNSISCDLKVIKLKNYNPDKIYELPIKPSPNLPNSKSINLYPSLCFFEGTNVNAGRGTDMQFQVFGSPFLDKAYFDFQFIPEANEGAKHPKHNGEICYGRNLEATPYLSSLNLDWLIEAYEQTMNKKDFFNPFFTKLAGTENLQQQIETGTSTQQIKNSWESDLNTFRSIRQKYILY